MLDFSEVVERELVTDDQLKRYERSDYSNDWYEVSPGDTITVTLDDGNDEHQGNGYYIFEVLESGIKKISANLDKREPYFIILRFLKEECKLKLYNPDPYWDIDD